MSRLLWHGVGLRFKLSYTRNDPVLDEIRHILVHQQLIRPVSEISPKKGLVYDTGVADTLSTTPWNVYDTDPGSATRCHGWHGLELSLKLSYTRNGRVLDDIRRILVQPAA